MEDTTGSGASAGTERLAGRKRRFGEIEHDPCFAAYSASAASEALLVCPFHVPSTPHLAGGHCDA